jgi:hypothetical protein
MVDMVQRLEVNLPDIYRLRLAVQGPGLPIVADNPPTLPFICSLCGQSKANPLTTWLALVTSLLDEGPP